MILTSLPLELVRNTHGAGPKILNFRCTPIIATQPFILFEWYSVTPVAALVVFVSLLTCESAPSFPVILCVRVTSVPLPREQVDRIVGTEERQVG